MLSRDNLLVARERAGSTTQYCALTTTTRQSPLASSRPLRPRSFPYDGIVDDMGF
ncbi:MAG: hypothetical protein AVDCRST_MAG67-3504 [uncultured Solirubrobacteraceae bacterium]|uniref:Uncharacterized protein n=1 Tax=uncultured Solirubrobacteraceae bacterium TaxID=1162706 RepID=A0A6J4TIS4_9ACTN|nr:MAG: hypothetical protein AVDCRST_MAG67-3504 [uncultured Solirubrobacteraceae bacterium]